MPIKPENKALYPADWKQISLAAKERAGWKCEQCGVSHGAVGYREKDGRFVQLAASKADCGMEVEAAGLADGEKIICVCLTTHHWNGNPADNRLENLSALCERCHNRADSPMRMRHAADTRRQKHLAAGNVPLTGLEF